MSTKPWVGGNQQVAGINLYGLVIFIKRRSPHSDQTSIGSRFRWAHFEHFTLDMQLVVGSDQARPAQFVKANSKDAVRRPEFTFHEKTHSQSCSVPAARGQGAKHRFAGGLLVEVVGLRIELRGERDNLVLIYP